MSEQKERFIVTVDDKEYDVYLSEKGDGYVVEYNGSSFNVIADQLNKGKFLFKINNSSSEVDISRNGGGLDVFLEGKEMNVRVEPYNLAELRKKAGGAVGATEDTIIRAPMPGLVLTANVKAGDEIQKGKTLVVIEAMKMENMIKAPADGKIKEVFVSPGEAVDKGEKLVELE